ncbi:MAG: hypothetical protein ACRC57_09865 [Sarcina sp.]
MESNIKKIFKIKKYNKAIKFNINIKKMSKIEMDKIEFIKEELKTEIYKINSDKLALALMKTFKKWK